MIDELCAELRNYFIRSDNDIHFGTFTVAGGNIGPVPFLQNGQYFRIVGSVFNDGVWQYPSAGLKDETFSGAVWAMTVPPAVIALAEDIRRWCDENASAINSPYQSESFGGYSYTKGNYNGGSGATWQSQFQSRINKWRRVSVL